MSSLPLATVTNLHPATVKDQTVMAQVRNMSLADKGKLHGISGAGAVRWHHRPRCRAGRRELPRRHPWGASGMAAGADRASASVGNPAPARGDPRIPLSG